MDGDIQTYGRIQTYGGIQTYSGCIQKYWAIQTNGGVQTWRGTSKHVGGFQTYRGHPNIKGASKMWVVSKNMGASKHTVGASKHMGPYGHPLVCQSMLSLCCVCMGHPNIIKTYRGSSKHMLGVSKHMGCLNIQGAFLHAFLSCEAGFATSIIVQFHQHLVISLTKVIICMLVDTHLKYHYVKDQL